MVFKGGAVMPLTSSVVPYPFLHPRMPRFDKLSVQTWLTGLLLLGLVAGVWMSAETHMRRTALQDQRFHQLQQLSVLRASLESQINSHLLVLRGLAGVVSAEPDMDQLAFSRIAREMMHLDTALTSLAAGRNGQARLLYPHDEQAAQDQHTAWHDSMLQVVDAGDIVLLGPLRRAQGGSVFIARAPVFVDTGEAGRGREFWGQISAVFDAQLLLQRAELDTPGAPLRVALRGDDGLGGEAGVFFGDARVFDDPVHLVEVALPSGRWQMAGVAADARSGGESHIGIRYARVALATVAMLLLLWLLTRQANQRRRLLAETELEESRRRYRNLVENTQDWIWEIDAQGRYVYASPRVEQLLGYAPQELLGKTPFDLMPDAEAERVAGEFAAIAASRQPFNALVNSNRHRDGHEVVLETSGTPVFDEQGEFLGYRGVDRDITERRRLEQRDGMRIKVLEELAQGAALDSVLLRLVYLVEAEMPGARCAIYLLDDAGKQLVLAAAPSLPDVYRQAMDGLEIGPAGASYGSAAFLGKPVIVEDIRQHRYWDAFRELAMQAGVVACWAQPIRNSGSELVGIFAIHYQQPRAPDREGFALLAPYLDLAGIAIEREASMRRIAKDETWRRILIDQSRDGIVILDRAGKVYYANHRFAKMLGRSLEEIRQMHVWDWDAQMSRAELQQALQDIDEHGAQFETLHRHRDGRLLNVEITANSAQGEGRALVFCVCRDVTERKRDEQALRDSEERFTLAMRAANDGLWDWDMLTDQVYFSPRWKSMLGYREEELDNVFSTWEKLVDQQGHDQAMQAIRHCTEDGEPGFVIELRMRHKDGHWVHVLSRAILLRDQQGRPSRMVGTHVDITAQKQLEARLRDSEAQANLIIDTAPEAIIMTDSQARMVRVNPRVMEVFGYREQELLGQKVEMLLPDALREMHVKMRQFYMRNPGKIDLREEGVNTSLQGRRKDGSVFPLEAGVGPVKIGDEQHFVVTLIDISKRKQAEQAIRESEARLREERDFVDAVVEAAGSVIVVLDRDGRFVRFNRAAEQITGYRFEEVQGRPIWESLIPPQARPQVQQVFRQLVAGDIVGRFENEWLMKDGSQRLFDWRNTVLEDAQGKVAYVVAQGHDITDMRAAEQALAEHRDKLEQLVEERTATIGQQARIIGQSHDSIITTDLAGVVTSWNSGAERLFGLSAQQAIGENIAMVYPPEQQEFLQQQVIEPLKLQGQHEVDVQMWRADHSRFDAHLSLSMLFDESNQPVGMVGYAMDISERKRFEQALRESEANLEHAQEIAHIGSWHLDIVNNALGWSKETYRIFGVPLGAPVSMQAFIDTIHPDDAPQVIAAWDAAQQGKPYDIEHRLVVDGEEKWVREQAEVEFDPDGRAVWALGTVQDISELKKAEQTTRQALLEAQRLAKLRSEFVANMSHEIRTPLNAVLGLARMGGRADSSQNARELFGRIENSSRHLLQVVNDVLDFSKVEAGKLQIEQRPFKLRASIDNVIKLVEQQAKAKALQLQVDFADGLPGWILGDALRLEQILLNLLSNAVKFTESGSVRLLADAQAQQLRLCISDTGIGISEEHLRHLFRPFEQGDASTTRRFGGTGLGLTISDKLAQMMGGRISVRSRLGEGSEFELNLPLRPAAAPREARPAQVAAGGRRLAGLRVLAAEDVEVNRLVLADLLDQEGAHVLFAENGRQAIELLQEQGVNSFDVVLMDIQMPVMDGYTATGQIRSLAADLPVIGLTAHALEDERERCLAAGMAEHVAKPVEPDELVAAIRRLVPSGEGGHAAGARLLRQPAHTPAAAQSQLIDTQTLLQRFKGRESFVRKLLGSVRDTHATTPQKLRAAAEQQDVETLRFVAHSLKGMAGNMQVARLLVIARQVEAQLKAGKLDSAVASAQQLAQMLEGTLAEIDTYLQESTSAGQHG